VPIADPEINAWLETWKANGLKHDFKTYLQNAIREFYYTEGIFSKYRLNKSRRLNNQASIAGLEIITALDCRFATNNDTYYSQYKRFDENDFNFFVVSNWLNPSRSDYQIYNKLDQVNPFKYPVAVNYAKNASFGEELYSYPVFYYGLKEWIKGSNSSPKLLRNFFKNLLTAKFHVKIPGTWVDKKREVISALCEKNRELKSEGKPIVTEYNTVKLIDDSGNILDFRESMLTALINAELRKLTDLMSGDENAGKLWATIKYHTEWGLEEWVIEDIPLKIKDFVDATINYNKYAIQAILEGKGIDPSISNVSKDGIISNSGANVYYNYLIYLNCLEIPETICTYDINNAIHLNFPAKKDIWLGFYHNIPMKQQDIPPTDRLNQSQPNN
jgi:hypothetical protein